MGVAGLGESKGEVKDPAGKYWLFTLGAEGSGSYKEEEVRGILSDCSYVIGQLERGEEKTETNPEGYLHYQIYAEWPTSRRTSSIKRRFGAGPGVKFHLERRLGTAQEAADYCSKEETRVGELITWGTMSPPSEQGRRSDVDKFHGLIMSGWSAEDVAVSYPSSLRMLRSLQALQEARDRSRAKTSWQETQCGFLWGESGIGKSRALVEEYGDDLYRVISYGSGMWEGYRGQRVIILEDYQSQLDLSFLLAVSDGYRPIWLPARYRDRLANHEQLWITSNAPWSEIHSDASHDTRGALDRRFTYRRRVTAESVRDTVREFAQGSIAEEDLSDFLG